MRTRDPIETARDIGHDDGRKGLRSDPWWIGGVPEAERAAYLAGHQAGVDKRTLEEKK